MSAARAFRLIRTTAQRQYLTPARSFLSGAQLRQAAAFSQVSRVSAIRAFSSSTLRLGEGTNIALSQKLQEELTYENEAAKDVETTPEFLSSFLQQGTWAIDDMAGNDEVSLSRTFGNEHLRLTFSIADIQSEEEFQAEEGVEGSEDGQTPYPIRVSLSITKKSAPGALSVDMVAQEGHFIVENISFYSDTKIGTELTAEADWKRRGLYIGPQFDTLDMSVQEEFEKFLQERGVNETVALFIPEYAEHKEQKEYVKWLGKVKSFIDA